MNNSDLTYTDIRSLPIELRCAYFLCGWNKNADIKSVDDWVNIFYIFFRQEYDDDVQAKSRIRKAHRELLDFVQNFINYD